MNVKPDGNAIYSLEALLAAIQQGYQPQYLLFWGHTPRKDGQIGKECLSQWWVAPFEADGVTYASAEHFMMAGKARLFGDTATLAEILQAPTPKEAKALGRKVTPFDGPTWDRECFDIVVQSNLAKFGQNEALREFLLGTQDKVLVEASPYDRIWGIGMAESAPGAQDPAQWRGRNLLGFALMQARDRLR